MDNEPNLVKQFGKTHKSHKRIGGAKTLINRAVIAQCVRSRLLANCTTISRQWRRQQQMKLLKNIIRSKSTSTVRCSLYLSFELFECSFPFQIEMRQKFGSRDSGLLENSACMCVDSHCAIRSARSENAPNIIAFIDRHPDFRLSQPNWNGSRLPLQRLASGAERER